MSRLFTSESVTEGHPDKVADAVSDAVLDALLAQDPRSRVAVETLVTTGLAFVAGEVSTNAYVDIPRVVRDAILGIGYNNAAYGIDGRTCGVMTSIDEQSPDIAQGVDKDGAGDQGIMFGYATDLRSMTQGRAAYSMEFDHYEEVPRNIAATLTKQAVGV